MLKYDSHVQSYDMDIKNSQYQAILNKPIPIASFTWASEAVFTSLIKLPHPTTLFNVNDMLSIPFAFSAYYNMKATLVVHLSGTPMHSGTLIVAAKPLAPNSLETPNDYMCAPHAFLYANQASSVEVEIPFYNATKYRNTFTLTGVGTVSNYPSLSGATTHDYAWLSLYVLNQLAASTGASTSLYGTVELVIKEINFKVPTDMHAEFTPVLAAVDEEVEPQSHGAMAATVHTQSLNAESYNPGPVDEVQQRKEQNKKTYHGLISQAINSVFGFAKNITSDILDLGRNYIYRWTGLHNKNLPQLQSHVYAQHRNNPNVVDSTVTYERLDPFNDYRRITDDFYFQTNHDEMDVYSLASKPQYVTTFTVTAQDVGTCVFSRPIQPNMGIYKDGSFDSVLTKLAYLSTAWSGPMELIIQSCQTNFQQCKLIASLFYGHRTDCITSTPVMKAVFGCPNTVMEFGGGGTVQCVDLPFFHEGRHCLVSHDPKVMALSHGMVYIHILERAVQSGQQPADMKFNVYVRAKPGFQFYGYPSRQFDTVYSGAFAEDVEPQAANISEMQNVTDQECVQDSMESNTSPPMGGIRPFVNLRDVVRRLYPVYQNRYTVSAANPTYIDFPINQLILGNGRSSPLAMTMRMFYGVRAGFRIKVEANGVVDSKLVYIPPSQYYSSVPVTLSSTTIEPSLAAVKVALQDGTAILGADIGYPAVFVDHANYNTVGYSDQIKSLVGKSPEVGQYTAESVIEAEIPFMNFTDFNVNIGLANSAAVTDYGTIRWSFIPQAPVAASAPVLNVKVYMGMDDEARLGFQCISPYETLAKVSTNQIMSAMNNPSYNVMADPSAGAAGAFIPIA